jgi:hypothetical protein
MTGLMRIAAGFLLALAFGTAGAQAGVLASYTNIDGFQDFLPSEKLIPLAPGRTTLTFKTTRANTTVMITYNAECAVLGPASKRLSIRITVDNVNTQPAAGVNFALCAATNATQKIYSAVSRVAVIKVPLAGTHTVRVYGRLPDGATFASVDDTTIVVQD